MEKISYSVKGVPIMKKVFWVLLSPPIGLSQSLSGSPSTPIPSPKPLFFFVFAEGVGGRAPLLPALQGEAFMKQKESFYLHTLTLLS